MAKKKEIKDDSSDQSKKSQTFRFAAEMLRKLKLAAQETGRSQTGYVVQALKDRFKKDGIRMNPYYERRSLWTIQKSKPCLC